MAREKRDGEERWDLLSRPKGRREPEVSRSGEDREGDRGEDLGEVEEEEEKMGVVADRPLRPRRCLTTLALKELDEGALLGMVTFREGEVEREDVVGRMGEGMGVVVETVVVGREMIEEEEVGETEGQGEGREEEGGERESKRISLEGIRSLPWVASEGRK